MTTLSNFTQKGRRTPALASAAPDVTGPLAQHPADGALLSAAHLLDEMMRRGAGLGPAGSVGIEALLDWVEGRR